MRAVTAYRLNDAGNTGYRTRHAIGPMPELRKDERAISCNDLLRLARKLFATNPIIVRASRS